MRSSLAFIVAALMSGLSLGMAGSPETPCIVALGDSITRGARPAKGAIPPVLPKETFCALLEEGLGEGGFKARVINAGIPSNRTDQGVKRLETDVLVHRPDFVLIMFGTNDSCHDKDTTGPRLPLADYRRNLESFIASIRAAGGEPILMTPLPLREKWGATRHAIYREKGANGAILPYVETCRAVAAAKDVPLIDHFRLWTALGPDFIASHLPDGCHPNAAGHRVLSEAILPVLLARLPGGS